MSNLHGYALAGLNLVSFDLATPNTTEASVPIVGLTAGETLVGIDFRPANGLLYGLGVNAGADTGTLYVISTRTGVAGAVGSFAGAGDLPPGNFGFDFNPSVDRIRVTTDTGLNFRLNPNSGAIAGVDTSIPANDISGVAYTNNRPDSGNITTLYALDALSDFLNVQNPPNGGVQIPVGPLGVDFSNANGFDIPLGVDAPANNAVTSGTGYALLTAAGTVGLYGVDLLSGAATLVGTFLDGVTPTGGFAIRNNFAGIPVVALSADGTTLVRFDSAAPATLAGNAISGIAAGETLVGIDYRPLTGELYGLAVNAAADTGTLYLLQVGGGAATVVGAPGGVAFVSSGGAVDLPAGGYGMDFDPTADRIRITTESGLNFRIEPTGAPVDGDVIAAGTNPDIAINGLATGASATAYTNSFGQFPGGPTTQYTLDSVSDTLFIQNSSFGTLSAPHAVTLNGSRLDFTSVSGFDIPSGVEVAASGSPAFGFGLAALTVAGVTSLYAINLGTGAAIDLGAIGTGADSLTGLSLGAPPALRIGSAGADSFVAFGGSERIDAGGGIDTVTFGFKRSDATVTHQGDAVIIDTVSSHTVLTGFEKFVFNGDGAGNILWRNASGSVAEWRMNAAQIGDNKSVGSLDGAWHFQDTGDFNADAHSDVLWRHDNGHTVLWTRDGSQIVANQLVAAIGNDWHNEGVGDFGGDGKADVLWHNDSGQVALWTMDGAQITNNQLVGNLGPGWHFQGLLDAGGDGKSDVLLRNDSGQVVLWTMDGAQITANQSVANLGLDWNIVGTGDFDGDAKGDVLLRNDSGQVVIWQMNGNQITSNQSVATPGNEWHVQDVDDYNSDGKSDVLWRNDSGQVAVWEMDGATITSNHTVTAQGGAPAPIGLDWTVLSHHYDVL